MSILEVFPQKRPVRLGDRVWILGELRIRDIARLQECVETLVPHPFTSVRDHIESLEGRARQRAILKLQRDAAEWPPTFPDAFSVALLTATIKGGILFLMAVLGRDNPIDTKIALDLYGSMTDLDWARLQKAVWGITDAEEFERLLVDDQSSGSKPDWPKIIAEVQERTRLTLDQIGDLTINQFNALRTGKGREKYKGEDWTNLTNEEVSRRLQEQHELLAEGDDNG